MATNHLHSLADETPNLRKQIRCMTGVFHIFNRHHILPGSSAVSHHKRVPPGSLPVSESSVIYQRSPNPEMHLNKHFMEKGRVSTESFKDSFSSWSPSPDRSSASRKMNHQSLDLRDVVKDSIYREARGLGLSPNVLVEFQEPNWYCDEPSKHSRSKSCQFKDGFPFSLSKSYPRFSYDGRETDHRLSMKELPRPSLDGRDRSIRTLNSVSLIPIKPFDLKPNPNPPSRNPRTDKGMITKPPNVVAKLMGLETFPDSSKPTSPCWKNPDLKPNSRVSIETAPWKHTKSSSVYNEMDKRSKNLEFAESGNDLNALKQILEAMQAVEARKNEKHSDHDHQNPPSANVSRGQETHIVIMKPAKLVKKGKDPITDSFKPKKQSNIHPPESRSGNGRRQPSNFRRTDDEKRKLSGRNGGREVNASEYFEETNSSSTQEKSTLLPEYPSPISVLDDSVYMEVYMENSPSPVKHTPNTRKDYAKQSLAETLAKDEYEARNDTESSTMINRKKLQKVEDLVQKLKRLNSSHDEAHTDYIASLCENTNPNNIYISEILLASGILLRDLESFQFHSSGHPINPDLFLVLERTKFRKREKEKSHRKLIFDSVNEILLGRGSAQCVCECECE